jgi:hypothetical protein
MLTLSIAVTGLLLLLGIGFVFLAETVSGEKELDNTTDAATQAAAKQIYSVCLTPGQAQQLPPVFSSFAVDQNGQFNSNSSLNTYYNIISYNNCAAQALQDALDAADSGAPDKISAACTEVVLLNQMAANLDNDILNSPNPLQAASNIMTQDPVNNLPIRLFGQSSPQVVPSSVDFGYYATDSSTANVYLSNAFYTKSSQITNWVNQVLSSISSSSGPKFLAANKPIDLSKLTGKQFTNNGNPLYIAFVPIQAESTHNIPTDQTRFMSSPPGVTSAMNISVPHNAVRLQGTTSGNTANTAASITSNKNAPLIAMSAAVANYPVQSTIQAPPLAPPAPRPVYISLIHKHATFSNRKNNLNIGATGIPAPPGHQSMLHTVTCVVKQPFTVSGSEGSFTVQPGTRLTIYTGDLNMSFVHDLVNAGDIVIESNTLSAPTDKAPVTPT